jgi:hypothetical protein
MRSQSRTEASSMLACVVQAAPASTPAVEELRYRIAGRAVTKIWGSAEVSVLRLQAREHLRAVEQRDRGTLMVMAESDRCLVDGG